MDSESVYTNDEITKVAEGVAETILESKASDLMRPYIFKAEEWQRGLICPISLVQSL